MQHLSTVYLAIFLVAAVSSQIEAKRGCALFGHACYGGHGKRSEFSQPETVPIESGPLSIDKLIQQQQGKLDAFSPQLSNGNSGLGFNQQNRIDNRLFASSPEYRFALYNLLKQWMDDTKKVSDENQRSSEVIYKNNFV